MFRKILHNLLLVGNIIFALGLVACYLSVYISPEKFWLPAIVGLLYPFFLLINLGYLFYWIFRWRWLFLISLLAVALGVNHLNSFIQLPFGKSKKDQKVDLKVMSYNVNLFKLYSWSKSSPTYSNITSYIKKNNFDVVCLQEFYVKEGKFTEEQAKAKLGMNSYIKYILKRQQSGYGIAIFTKYPIINTARLSLRTLLIRAFMPIFCKRHTIRIYNNHLQSIRLKERNFNFLLKIEFRNESNKYDELKDILSRYIMLSINVHSRLIRC
jgi:hypothetical protein